ncbi:MAG: hypothetical protein LBI18_07865 [Planctomycetaceae bacterium]|nr:hypothetical protein [Planctomycetaceae bacterium]
MKKIFSLTIIVICLFVTDNSFAQKASDFLPPAAGGKTEPDQSKIIATETNAKEKTAIIIAQTMQDGAAKSVELMSASDEFDPPTISTVILLSGKMARLATGSSTVIDPDKLKNEDQKRDAFRDAVMRAYTEAQANLVKALSDKTVAESAVAMMDKVGTKVGETTSKNTLRTLTEKIGENFNGTCRPRIWGVTQNDDGLIEVAVYHIEDDKDATRINAGSDIFTACLNAEYNKIKSGRLLPEGGEIYQNASTGEYCYVGYANSVIYHSNDREDQAESILDAKRSATMRAQTALLGIMHGKGCKRITSLGSTGTRRKGTLEGITGGDEQNNIQDGFNTTQESSIVTDIAVNGTLPPGIEIRTVKIPSGNYYYAFAMYKTKKPVDPINAQINSNSK